MEADLIDILLADAGVSAVVGSRIHWMQRPQGEGFPALVLQIATRQPLYKSSGELGLTETTVQMDLYAPTYAQTRSGSAALRTLLSGKDVTQGGTVFLRFALDSERDGIEDAAGVPDPIHRASMDYSIWHKETP